MSFYFINVETKGKYKNVEKKSHIWKNIQVKLMSLYYMNVKIIGKCRYVKINNLIKKKYTSLVNEFLIHTAEVCKIGK